jgi:hypothetical protein
MMTLSEHKKEAMREYFRKYRQRNRAPRIRKLDQERRALMREERNDER